VSDLFFYGSLRDRTLIEIVLGRAVSADALIPARAPGHAARRLAHEEYPVLIAEPGGAAEGVLVAALGEDDLARLAFFEEAEYGLAPIMVETDAGPREALYFRGTDKPPIGEGYWDFAFWQARDRAVAREAARELMEHYGVTPVERIDDHWPGIMNRARQRARGQAEPVAPPPLGSAFSLDDVTVEAHRRSHRGYLTVEEIELRHRRFDGGTAGPVSRSVVLWGDAVTVLPYDPVRDEVLLIEQFRAPLVARGNPRPWCIEVVAGRIDTAGTAEDIARREAAEEAGLTLGRLEPVGEYFPTAGLAAEKLVSFVGEASLAGAGGLHGLDAEHEDIRTMVVPADEAIAAATAGEIDTAAALVSLLWLAANRDRLRKAWCARSAGA